MTKSLIITSIALFFIGCSSGVQGQKATSETDDKNPLARYSNTITQEDLKTHLFVIASDEMQGRDTGSEGQKKAGRYLIEQYQKMGISFPPTADGFYQPIPSIAMKIAWFTSLPHSETNWAFIEGGQKKDEVLILSAHYDHIGMKNGEIYNGADDNASGTTALLEIAQAFIEAKKAGYTPLRSILFLHVTAEEYGLHGSRYYTDHPIFSIENTVANINIDMIGRRGFGKETNDNYVYVIGSDRMSSDLHKLSVEANKSIGLELDYTYNDLNDPNRFYYRSDHYNFAKNGIPAIFYFDGVHQDYHQPSDTPDKIDFPLFAKRTKLAFATAWKLANTENRPVIDKDGK